VQIFRQELAVHVPVRVIVGHSLVLHEAGEALVQPQVIPPGQGYQVTEPPIEVQQSSNRTSKLVG
jgi:hypothetical protein